METTKMHGDAAARRDMNEALAAMSALVARLYRRPMDEEVATYFRTVDIDDPEDTFMANELCRHGVGLIKAHFIGNDTIQALHGASADFHRLFVGPMKLVAAPWSSVYMDLGSLFGPTALEVERVFKANGFGIPEGNHEPCDHIGYEFAFIEEMHKAAARAWDEGRDPQPSIDQGRSFIERYMLPWTGTFLDKVAKGARTDAYRGLADLTRGLLGMEATFFGCSTDASATTEVAKDTTAGIARKAG